MFFKEKKLKGGAIDTGKFRKPERICIQAFLWLLQPNWQST